MPKTNRSASQSSPRASSGTFIPQSAKRTRSHSSPHEGGSLKRCFCAFCKSPRSIYGKTHISFADVILAAVGSVLFGWLLWQSFDPRAFMFFGFGLGVAEIFVILRRRFSIACPKCGFDSLLYRKNPQAAVARVKAFRKERFADPLWIFSPPVQPPLTHQPFEKQSSSSKLVRQASGAHRPSVSLHRQPNVHERAGNSRGPIRHSENESRQPASQTRRARDNQP